MLMHHLMLALHHTSVILQHKSLVHHSLEIIKVLGLQSIAQFIIQSIQKAVLLLLISVNFMRSIARQLSELGAYSFMDMDPCFRSWNSFFSLITPYGT
jgi:hypothetical protein